MSTSAQNPSTRVRTIEDVVGDVERRLSLLSALLTISERAHEPREGGLDHHACFSLGLELNDLARELRQVQQLPLDAINATVGASVVR